MYVLSDKQEILFDFWIETVKKSNMYHVSGSLSGRGRLQRNVQMVVSSSKHLSISVHVLRVGSYVNQARLRHDR